MVALFLLFPRIAPLWAVPGEVQAKTGLSGSLRMGGITELALDESPAFRVRFTDGALPDPAQLYWRGPVLGRFDGVEWSRSEVNPVRSRGSELEVRGRAIGYEVTLEPSRLALLPLLEATPPQGGPQLDDLRAFQRADLQWATSRPITERLRFTARAWLDHRHGPRRDPSFLLAEFTDLPSGYNPRTLAWAEALRAEPRLAGATSEQLVQAVLETIRRGFTYTLTPGTYGDTDEGRFAIDEFWLDRRRGFCEHFSTAFVVVMRAMDIPARVVTGYQGLDLEAQDGWYVVRNSFAHAWAEVWIEGRGWVRVDPTAAVAPERVVQSRPLRAPQNAVANAIGAVNPALLAQLRAVWERIDNRWSQWVLNYSRNEQFDLLARLGVRSPDWSDLTHLLIGLLSAAALAGAAWAWWDRHRRDPWQRLAHRIARRLSSLGIEAAPHDTPRQLAARVRAQLGTAGETLARELDALEALRYGRTALALPTPTWWRAFARAAAHAARSR